MNVPIRSSTAASDSTDATKPNLTIDPDLTEAASFSLLASSEDCSPRYSLSVNTEETHIESTPSELGIVGRQSQFSTWFDASRYASDGLEFDATDSPENTILQNIRRWLRTYSELLEFPAQAATHPYRFLDDPVVQLACLPAPRVEIGGESKADPEWVRDISDAVEQMVNLDPHLSIHPKIGAYLVWLRILLRADSSTMTAHAFKRMMAIAMETVDPGGIPNPGAQPNWDDSGHFEQKAAAYAQVLRALMIGGGDLFDGMFLREFAVVMGMENNFCSSILRGVWERVQDEIIRGQYIRGEKSDCIAKLCGLYKSLSESERGRSTDFVNWLTDQLRVVIAAIENPTSDHANMIEKQLVELEALVISDSESLAVLTLFFDCCILPRDLPSLEDLESPLRMLVLKFLTYTEDSVRFETGLKMADRWVLENSFIDAIFSENSPLFHWKAEHRIIRQVKLIDQLFTRNPQICAESSTLFQWIKDRRLGTPSPEGKVAKSLLCISRLCTLSDVTFEVGSFGIIMRNGAGKYASFSNFEFARWVTLFAGTEAGKRLIEFAIKYKSANFLCGIIDGCSDPCTDEQVEFIGIAIDGFGQIGA